MSALAIAHKKLRGDLNNSEDFQPLLDRVLYYDLDDDYYICCEFKGFFDRNSIEYISTVEEFNNFKGDNMTDNIYTQEMADNGVFPSVGMECLSKKSHQDDSYLNKSYINGYSQDGKWLIFTDYLGNIESHNISNGVYDFKPLTPPVELIDGKAYQFDYNNGAEGMRDTLMRYRKSGDYFYFDNVMFERKYCTNIQPLTVEAESWALTANQTQN